MHKGSGFLLGRIFYKVILLFVTVSSSSFFFIAALTIRCFGQIVALPRWNWLLLLLRYFLIDNCRTCWYLVSTFSPSSPLRLFRPYHHHSMVNSYLKKDYSKGEVNAVVKITQISLQKMKKNVTVVSFYCLVGKIWKIIVFHVAIRRGKKSKIHYLRPKYTTRLIIYDLRDHLAVSKKHKCNFLYGFWF